MDNILFSKSEGVATITLNRPKSFNSFTREMAMEVQAALDDCAEDDSVRCVVLTGEGRAFCAGQDLVEVTTPEKHPGFNAILKEHYEPIITRLRAIEKPVIGAVNGVAAGAGANIAIACDIVVAKESASFIQAFSAIGLIPDSAGTFFLPRIVGFQKALAISMLADKISAREAEQMGMIYKVVSDEEFDTTIASLSSRVAKLPTKGLALTKKAYNESLNNKLLEQLDLENTLQYEASSTEDYKEGVAAFIEKRKPNFKGK